MNIPVQYQWLLKEGGPQMVVQMLQMFGLKEVQGAGDNPVIIAWAKEVGLSAVYKHDETSWCGLAMAVVAQRSKKDVPKDPLWALNWAKFGVAAADPMLGDVLTFKRFDNAGKLIGGHVTLYVGEDPTYFHCLGGNQSDSINITRVAKNRLNAARRPSYTVQPANVRKIYLSAAGDISTNEA